MSGYIERTDRGQMTLFPDRLEDWVREDNPVRVVDLFVDEMDLAELGFGRVSPALTGQPGYHPSVLPKPFIYSYLNRGWCQTNSNRLHHDGKAVPYTEHRPRHSARAAARFILKYGLV